MPTDDLAPLLVPQPQPTMRYGQGTVLAWDTTTFANRIRWRDTILEDLPVSAGTSGLTIAAGDEVVLLGADAGGQRGVTQWWVHGPLVLPGSDAAARQVAFLSGSLASAIVDDLVEELLKSAAGQDLAAFVTGQRVHAANVAAQVAPSSTSFGDLSGSPGPTISDVSVSSAGVAIVMLSAGIFTDISSGPDQEGGYMGVAVSGATTVAPDPTESLVDDIGNSSGDTGLIHITRMTSVRPLTGLNEGTHTFTAKYRQFASGHSPQFFDRSMVVIAL